MKILVVSGLLVLLSACAYRQPSTGYVPASPNGLGYKIHQADSDVTSVRYEGNSQTYSSHAMAYSMLAAYDHCHAKNLVPIVTYPVNFSKSDTYTAVNSYSIPQYSKNGPTTYSTHVSSYPVTTTYPKFETAFRCFSAVKEIKDWPKTENISRELVHPVTKDFRGGLLVKEDSGLFKANDVVIRVGAERVDKALQVNLALQTAKTKVPVQLIRAQKIKTVSAETIDVTESVKLSNLGIIAKLCEIAPRKESLGSFVDPRPMERPAACATSDAAFAANEKSKPSQKRKSLLGEN